MNKAVQNAKAAVDAAQRETRRVADAIEIHSERLEGLKAGLTQPPDRSGELAEMLASVALGEATDKDVATLRAIIAKEAETTSKRNSADRTRIDELQQQLAGLELRRERAQDAEQQARTALLDAVVAEFKADAEKESQALLSALQQTSEAFERFAAACMALDSVDNIGRMNVLIDAVKLDLSGYWPMPGVEYETLATLGTYESRRRAFARFERLVGEMAAIGADLGGMRS